MRVLSNLSVIMTNVCMQLGIVEAKKAAREAWGPILIAVTQLTSTISERQMRDFKYQTTR